MGEQVTAVGFEPTPFRNGALSHRLRPLGQTVLDTLMRFHFFLARSMAPRSWRFWPVRLARRKAALHACRECGAAVVGEPCAARGRPKSAALQISCAGGSSAGRKHGRNVRCCNTTCATGTAELAPALLGCALALRASGRRTTRCAKAFIFPGRKDKRERERERERERLARANARC